MHIEAVAVGFRGELLIVVDLCLILYNIRCQDRGLYGVYAGGGFGGKCCIYIVDIDDWEDR